jgi:hypothetical protein
VTASTLSNPSIASHIASTDLLNLYRDGHPDYKRIAELIKLNKLDLAEISSVAKCSVRFDEKIPEALAELLRELAHMANLVAEYFAGDAFKVSLWFEIANPMLGNVSPRQMIRLGRHRKLLSFIVSAREENAETGMKSAATLEDVHDGAPTGGFVSMANSVDGAKDLSQRKGFTRP